ncbi:MULTISPECIES: SPL family radical SAM protein [Pseudothermotoga]|jgi:DNA repair photolyase|uniref:SPL family radical SAM protein n=1 Tax=Pseudothermotoga TaxID=1643951 RepID=UPI00040933C3|nr:MULTISPECIES: radical SAM protein [Pseudothermotoga]MDK2883592.1 hypothetical protein [Pseudothermotoga sp.]
MIHETLAKKLITKTKLPVAKYVINPYIGCTFGCKYCYAKFIGPFKHTNSEWGKDVWVKINAADILERELSKKQGDFFLSSICDPYQQIEKKYQLTRKIIEILNDHFRKIHIMSKSTLILRDIDLLKDVSVTITITTDREDVRRILEPGAPSIEERINILKILKENRISVSVFVGPALPMNAEKLSETLARYTDKVFLDKLNYPQQVKTLYEKNGWSPWLSCEKFDEVSFHFKKVFGKENVIL